MRGTVRLFRLFGINVYLHWSFIFLILFLMYSTYSEHQNVRSFFILLALVLIIFACVIMHEYGHALTARRYGISTHDITILPIGGVARLTHIPKNPVQELFVVFAGPAVNLAIFIILSLVAVLAFHYEPSIEDIFIGQDDFGMSKWGKMVLTIANMNLFLMLFNLIPAFPMDGGRIFRALMCFAMPRPRATFIASIVGRAFAVAIFGFAVYNPWHPEESFKPMLALLAVAVFISARNEYKQVRSEARYEEGTVKEIMKTHFLSFQTSMLTGDALLQTQKATNPIFLVFDQENALYGFLETEDLNDVRKNSDHLALVSTYTNTNYVTTDAYETLKAVSKKMNQASTKIGIVKNQNQILGTVYFDDILTYINQ